MLLSIFTSTAQRVVIGGLAVVTVALGALAIYQHFEILNGRLDLSHEQNERLEETNQRQAAAIRYAKQLATVQETHTLQQKDLTDDFNKTLTGLKAAADARIADARRLQDGSEARAASYRRLAEAGPAQCQYLGDRSAALDAQLAAGRVVVEGLVGDLKRRDSEVMTLKGLLLNDRAAVLAAQPQQ